jgi:small subunit ribosomal protein S16
VAVKIRLMRVGKRKQPTYRVVIADGRSPRDGRIIESIGKYGPRHEPSLVDIDGDKALDWLRKGAQPTETVQKLLAAAGVWEQYEQEKGGPIKTKLARRGVTPGKTPPPPKERKSKKSQAEKPAAEAAPAPAEEPAAPEPTAAEAATTEGAPPSEDAPDSAGGERPEGRQPASPVEDGPAGEASRPEEEEKA